MLKRWLLVGLMLFLAAVLVVGCGSPQEDYDAVVAERDALQAQVTSLQSEITKLQSDVAAAESKVSSLESQVSSLETQLATAEERISELEGAGEGAEGPPATGTDAKDVTAANDGETLTVSGTVEGHSIHGLTGASQLSLVGSDLIIWIEAKDVDKFLPMEDYIGKKVTATGEILLSHGDLRIAVTEPSESDPFSLLMPEVPEVVPTTVTDAKDVTGANDGETLMVSGTVEGHSFHWLTEASQLSLVGSDLVIWIEAKDVDKFLPMEDYIGKTVTATGKIFLHRSGALRILVSDPSKLVISE